MIEKFFDKYLFADKQIKNLKVLNYDELLNQFSYIDFNNIYIDPDTLINTDLLFCWEEFYDNIKESLIFSYLNFVDNSPVQFIYNGYHLKTLLLFIFKHFSKKRIPFKTLFNLKEWSKKQLVLNVSLKNGLVEHKNNPVSIEKFVNIFNNINYIFKDFEDNKELELTYLYFYNYYQMIIGTKEFLYINNPIEFDTRFMLTKQIDKTININVQILAIFSNLLMEAFIKHKQKAKFKTRKSKTIWDNTQSIIGSMLLSTQSYYSWENPKISKLKKVESDKLLNVDNEFEDKLITINENKEVKETEVNYQVEKSYNYVVLNPEDFKPIEPDDNSEEVDNNQNDYYPTLLESIDITNQNKNDNFSFDQEEYEKFMKGKI